MLKTSDELQLLCNKVEKHYRSGLPFVMYHEPNSTEIIAQFQQDDRLTFVGDFEENGFVFAPFDGNEMVLLPAQSAEFIRIDYSTPNEKIPFIESAKSDAGNSKKHHLDLVQKGIDAIKNGDFEKVVLSRTESIIVPKFDFLNAFQKMMLYYPEAFGYCFFHPKVGLWMGAFSEQLFSIQNKQFRTMSVAGTQLTKNDEVVSWGSKEKTEQQFVTDFLVASLANFVSDLKLSEPYTLHAGNVQHLKTDIEGKLKSQFDLKNILAVLHPTPAVCGFPKESSKKFILDNEGFDRQFYAGFLGTLNSNIQGNESESALYVNLRCMKIEPMSNEKAATITLFMGGGITENSIPENEWIETVNKSNTMKSLLL